MTIYHFTDSRTGKVFLDLTVTDIELKEMDMTIEDYCKFHTHASFNQYTKVAAYKKGKLILNKKVSEIIWGE